MLTAHDMDGMREIAPFRNPRLFSEFLPLGYGMTTLNTVSNRDEVISLKVGLGTLITLYDDFADRPDRLNSRLLQLLYRIPFDPLDLSNPFLNGPEKSTLKLARSLFDKLIGGVKTLAPPADLIEVFYFDLKQFFLANLYSELLTKNPHLKNEPENRLYLHHNMGIVMAGMIDVMGIPDFDISELGRARSLFLLGQRAGRISNVLTTIERERTETDVTNELMAGGSAESLEGELKSIFLQMKAFGDLKSFSAGDYRRGIQSLHELHVNFKGVI